MSDAWQELLLGAGLFTAIVVTLTLLVLLLRTRILPGGTVDVLINGERTLKVARGTSLLHAMAADGLYLPSPCGGNGTCGQCRVTVTAGAGPCCPPRQRTSTGGMGRPAYALPASSP